MQTFSIFEKNLPLLSADANLPPGWLHGVSPNGELSHNSVTKSCLHLLHTGEHVK